MSRTPERGVGTCSRAGDVRVITTADHHPSGALFDDWRAITPPLGTNAVCPGCGGRTESDPAAMLGLVLVLVANTLVVAALVAAAVWILA